MIATVLGVLAANRTAWRRARNLRTAARSRQVVRRTSMLPGPLGWAALAGVLLMLAGAAVIAFHARLLWTVAQREQAPTALASLRTVLAGVSFTVPDKVGIVAGQNDGAMLLVATGMRAQEPLRIDMCTQVLDPAHPRLLPLRIGLSFNEAAALAARNEAAGRPATLRNIVLGDGLPHIEIGGGDARTGPLTLSWEGSARWVGDDGAAAQGNATFRQQGWLLLGEQDALHLYRRKNAACPQAGELVLQRYRAAAQPAASALVTVLPFNGPAVTARLAPGRYNVPNSPAPTVEDGTLFAELREHGLLRLRPDGLAELAPPDLAAWRALPAQARVAGAAQWDGPPLDSDAHRLLDHLYHRADGDYLREQVRVFNSERRLLAWRARALPDGARWLATASGAPLTTSASLPPSAARLFDRLPEGWGPWSRVAEAAERNELALALPAAASAGQTLELMLAGRVVSVRGASVRSREGACTGRACPAADSVQKMVLDLEPGARIVTLVASPIDAAGLAEARYRHLDVVGGQLAWRALPPAQAPVHEASANVTLADRNGVALWTGGQPSALAVQAGLAPLLGIRPEHVNSIAGMLARLPAASGEHSARLTLDLGMQVAAQSALECIGMRRGAWDGRACHGGKAIPPGRQAGLVLLDTEAGEILAAAGAGMASVDAANWDEVRNFDAADPAASPLRLPALQHDGGRDRSPGSTFKIVSALGLELAAQRDARLDAVLGGLPLDSLDALARAKGFAFRTAAATYPAQTTRAHITNFRDQGLSRRAQDGQLGLEQALTYSLNTWFAWSAELSDRTLLGKPEGGLPDLQALDPSALRAVRPILDMAWRLGFGQALRLDGGLLPAGYRWSDWDALQATPAGIDPVRSRHELRQMAIGLRMQATPLQMAVAAGAVGQGTTIVPRLLAELDGHAASAAPGQPLGVRLDRIRAGMKGVIDRGTGAGAFRDARFAPLRPGLYGKTGTAPTGERDANGRELATVWFTGWLEPGSMPGQRHRLAFATFVSRSEATGGEHAAPIVAALLDALGRRTPAH